MSRELLLDVKYLKGVGPKRAQLLREELSVSSLKDLLYTFPYKYIDRSEVLPIASLREEMSFVQVKGSIVNIRIEGGGRKQRLMATLGDGTGFVELIWFHSIKWMEQSLKMNRPYLIFGTPTLFNGRFSFAHPELDTSDNLAARNGLHPYYTTTERMKRGGLTSKGMHDVLSSAIASIRGTIPETLPPYLVAREGLMPLDCALRLIHQPRTWEDVTEAKRRLKFEELFFLQLGILREVKERQSFRQGQRFTKVGTLFLKFYHEKIPFSLTAAQQRVVKEMHRDMSSGRQMNRLLQGDVGSGKTIVALMAALLALDNQRQVCLMAPTEILAEQHLFTISSLLEGLPVKIALLTGSVKGKSRHVILDATARGEINILIGTHAVLEENVTFLSLGLAIIDEQHRFGVAQRARLWQKNAQPPHILVMTATPIPRTLAMTLYGDLDVSVIDELPPGRRPIKTIHSFQQNKKKLYQSMRRELEKGHQIYYIFPLIQESEKMDLQDLENGFNLLKAAFPEYRVEKLHGRMSPQEKALVMEAFANGKTHILVSTTVIEVGVNVPNATVMVIEEAQRFGLSQLHQLRGRVGRGGEQSYCILVTPYAMGEHTRERMNIMTETTDGFKIAEEDLKLRGPGDIDGTQQSGIALDLKIASLARDGLILEHAREVARDILAKDPQENLPENELLWLEVKAQRESGINWSSIS